MIYTSKAKLYSKEYINEFKKYIDICAIINKEEANQIIEELRDFIGSTDLIDDKQSSMISLMRKGIVIHHGSMPLYARLLIERFINKGFARICFATSTLLQGIDMPFDIVWINNFNFKGPEDSKRLDLKNLIGRAGRTNSKTNSFDYGYVIINANNVTTFSKRMNASAKISEKSLLDSDIENIPEDYVDLVESIKNESF
ncbi:MAG: helicase, partial [Bacteroidetes bacterium]|nr:helicase [Bacteroidota bacterium]